MFNESGATKNITGHLSAPFFCCVAVVTWHVAFVLTVATCLYMELFVKRKFNDIVTDFRAVLGLSFFVRYLAKSGLVLPPTSVTCDKNKLSPL